jgi:hypothetical protein
MFPNAPRLTAKEADRLKPVLQKVYADDAAASGARTGNILPIGTTWTGRCARVIASLVKASHRTRRCGCDARHLQEVWPSAIRVLPSDHARPCVCGIRAGCALISVNLFPGAPFHPEQFGGTLRTVQSPGRVFGGSRNKNAVIDVGRPPPAGAVAEKTLHAIVGPTGHFLLICPRHWSSLIRGDARCLPLARRSTAGR